MEIKHPRLFETVQLGNLSLKNRIVMPPMTRSRSNNKDHAPTDIVAHYYAQRASAGLIVTGGVPVSPLGRGYAWTPGIYSEAQLKGWQKVTEAVHQEKGIIFAQLWHVGRISHPDITGGETPISSSSIPAKGVRVFVDRNGIPEFVEVAHPKAMTKEDIHLVVQEFKDAAKNAIAVGFDGVELHAANGYLINQFIDSEANARHDEYGGSVENRLRFLKEIVEAVREEIGADKIGVRVSPLTTLNGTEDKHPEVTYSAAARMLSDLGVAYLHIAEADWDDAPLMPRSFKEALRQAFKGKLIYAGKYTPESAEEAVKQGWADMVAFGRPFISNPDLPERIAAGYPLAPSDRETYFGGGSKGLTDYPTMKQEAVYKKAE